MEREDIERIEIDLLLEALLRRYGYDFRHYARASVRRRMRQLVAKTSHATIADLIPSVLHDEEFARGAIHAFSIAVTEMFRDPEFYLAIREQVVPYLRTYPFVKAWVAGCASGEEVYSLAILLKEEGLNERTTLFATDFNDAALHKAEEGIYPLKDIRQYTANYQRAGGTRSFADYYHAQYDSVIMDQALRAGTTFANHNLATDGVFGEMHIAFCRNVLIYFDRDLQDRVLALLAGSLKRGGFLCLGSKETLEFSTVQSQFKTVDAEQRIYQKRGA